MASNYVRATNIFSSVAHSDSPLFDFEIENDDLENFFYIVQMKDSVENITDEKRKTNLEDFKVFSTQKFPNALGVNEKFFHLLNEFFSKYNSFHSREDFGKLLCDVKAVEKLLDMKVEVIYLIPLNLSLLYFFEIFMFNVTLLY